jgi:MOSC domain-containing protein YiiM
MGGNGEGQQMSGVVASANVGGVVDIEWNGRRFRSAIGKTPLTGQVGLDGVNLRGDDQADRNAHGGPDRAAYAYAAEDYDWWESQLGQSLEPGRFGENLTVRDIDVSGALIGERWRIGSALVQVTSPRVPCYKLAYRMNDLAFVKRFADALRPGAYLAIVEPGDVAQGDAVEIVHRPDHDMSLAEMTRIFFREHDRIGELLKIAEMTPEWRAWAMEKVGS